jgi:hypothetical protein
MSDKSRRKLLKSIAAGSGAIVAGKSLPESWSRPVVDSVMLPAHAQTSGGTYSGTGLRGESVSLGKIEQDSLFARFIDEALPEAYAGNPGDGGGDGYYGCGIVEGSSAYVTIAGLNSHETGAPFLIRRGDLSMDGSEGTITASGSDISPCANNGLASRPARINPDLSNETELVVQILTACGDNQCDTPVLQIRIPRSASGCLSEPSVHTGECPPRPE